MKMFLILLMVSITVTSAYSQQVRMTKEQYEQKVDSITAARTIAKMGSLFTLSTKQQQALREATITLNRERKAVFMEYRKTPGLPEKMQQQEKVRDSIYNSIVGADNYEKFRVAMLQEREQKQAAMAERMRAKFGTVDTVNNKPPAKPVN